MFLLKKWWRDIFLYPRTDLTGSLDQYWEGRGRGQGNGLSAWQKERAEYALSILPKTGDFSVLDIGSGDGGVLAYCKSKRPGLSGTGVDLSETALSLLKQKGFAALQMELADPKNYSALPFADYVLMFEIIEHMPDTEALLAATLKIAQKGILISVPNSGFFTYRLRLLFGRFPLQWAVFPSEHLRFWTVADMWWWLRAHGVHNATIHTYQGVPLLKYLFPRWCAAGMIIYIPRP